MSPPGGSWQNCAKNWRRSSSVAPASAADEQIVEQLREFSEDGFHTSYYLPTELLLRLTRARARDSLRIQADGIAGQVRRAGVAAVSFDARLYGFVKEYLQPRIAPGVVYHTWALDLSLADPRFLDKLRSTKPFQDARVRTILVTYNSELTL